MNKPSIEKRLIPSTGELLPIVGLGTWQTFDVSNDDTSTAPLREVLSVMIENGATVIDSSPMYGNSEAIAGSLSSAIGINQKLFMATKVWTTGKDNGIRQMEESMRLLNRKSLDLMQVHNLTDWRSHLPTLRKWKDEGKIRYTGITHYTETAYSQVEQVLKTESIDFLQINYSLLSRKAEDRLFPIAQEKGVAILINRPFEEGRLFALVKGKSVPSWANEFDCESWAQFFLKFILANSAVTCVIPGTAKKHHMIDNLAAARGKLPSREHVRKMIEMFS